MLYHRFLIFTALVAGLVSSKPAHVYKLDDYLPDNSTSSSGDPIYKRILADIYGRQVHKRDDDGIPRKFAETKKCGNMKDPKSMGNKIKAAWGEAKQLAMAQSTVDFDYDFAKVHKQWLGKDWDGWGWWYNYKKIVSDNFNNARKIFSDSGFQAHEFIYWYCYDYGDQCDIGTVAYSWSSKYFFWRNHYTVFCPIFESLQTLGDAVRGATGDAHAKYVMENFETNRGQVMLHEVYHYTVVSNPRTGDYAYKAKNTWDLAKNSGTWYAFVNADSYALDAVAIYIQKHFKTKEPPIPAKYYNENNYKVKEGPSEKKATRQKVLADKPKGWKGAPVVELNPDPDFWTEVVEEGVKPLGPKLDISAVVFASKPKPTIPISAMKVTTVSAPPSGTRPTPAKSSKLSPHSSGSPSSPWCEHGASPHGTRMPLGYCMCGPKGALYYSEASGNSNPCPYTATPGPTITWSTMGQKPTSTKKPAPNKPYKTGTCSMHIFESATGGDKGDSLKMEATVKDGGGKELTKKTEKQFSWGETIKISKSGSKLDDDIEITFSKSAPKIKKRIDLGDPGTHTPPPDWSYEKRSISIKIGDQTWDTDDTDEHKTPHINVGKWDRNGLPPHRDMDAYWKC